MSWLATVRAAHPVAGLLLASLVAWPGIGRAATASDGERAYDAGQYGVAHDIWTGLASAGDPHAAFSLGALYERGAGGTPDPSRAYCWYRRAAGAGLPEAAFNVAVMHDSGRGVPHDATAAAIWYARAAAFGFARAEFNLGQLYEAGEGVPRNTGVAAAWYRLAAANGLPAAADRLGALNVAVSADAATSPHPVSLDEPAGMAGPAADAPGPDAANAGAAGDVVPLTWQAVPQSVPVSFYVEVLALSQGPPRPAFAAATPLSAVLATLSPGRYAGRVFSVATDASHYAIGGWTRFTVGAVPPSGCAR